MENKLTIDHLKNYLGTGVKILRPDGRTVLTLSGIEESNTLCFDDNEGWKYGDISKNRLICYRLSDLDKFIPKLGFVPIDIIRLQTNASHFQYIKRFIYDSEDGSFSLIPFWVAEQLFQWHFWPFGEEYFEQGLVIDKLKHGRAS